MLTLLASFAQEEIVSLSNNVKWGTRKRMEQGIPNGHFRVFGYRWEGDQLVIVPEEATIVRRMDANQFVYEDGKTIVCGHWHASYGHTVYEKKGSEFGPDANFQPYYGNGIIALDACTVVSGFVNCIIIDD